MASPAKPETWPQRALWLVAAFAAVHALGIAVWFWPGSMPDTNSSGVWIALADDAAHGDLYRPLQSSLGTGGTRYMPLFFSLHGVAIYSGLPTLGSGIALTLISALLFVAAMGILLRQLGVSPTIAWPACFLMTGTVTFCMMSLTIRGDFLAAALNLLGVALALSAQQSNRPARWIWAGSLFGAAFLTKLTTVFGLLAVIGWLIFQRKPRPIRQLLAGSGLTVLLGLMAAHLVSEGRIWDSFNAVAHGGAERATWWVGPARFLQVLVRDPMLLIMAAPAIGVIFTYQNSLHPLAHWLVATTLSITVIIFTSPGTAANHLLDVTALAVLVLVLAAQSNRHAARWLGATVTILGISIGTTWLPGIPSIPKFFAGHGRPALTAPAEFLRLAGPSAHPILSENPLIPLLLDERPFVADAFNLDLISRSDNDFNLAFIDLLESGFFGAVVLPNSPNGFSRDATHPDDPLLTQHRNDLTSHGHLMSRFSSQIWDRYRVVYIRLPHVYLLRRDLPFPIAGQTEPGP